jgi:hypothetical protein
VDTRDRLSCDISKHSRVVVSGFNPFALITSHGIAEFLFVFGPFFFLLISMLLAGYF